MSLPVRERGLKFIAVRGRLICCRSLPVRERGLKSDKKLGPRHTSRVAPRAGAWIEIILRGFKINYEESLPVRERGLK